ncbi:MAG: multicopper oxidase domain-containing protein [Gemmatimonadota bacterium]
MLSRRDWLTFGAGAIAGAAGIGAWLSRRPSTAAMAMPATGPIIPGSTQAYGHGAMPPLDAGPLSLDSLTHPPAPLPRGAAPATVELDVIDQSVAVSVDRIFPAWTFGGTIPGPVLRAREGDQLAVHLRNRTGHAHNLHFHGRHDIAADGWEPVAPGGETTYRFTAGPFGLHPYHCDFTPADDHIANGLYGMLIVDPPGGRPAAHEISLVLGGFDVDGDGKSELFGWNGMAGFFAKFPLKALAGELVRVYLLNMVMDAPLASFHLHAEMFDVYRSGTSLEPDERTDLLMLGPAERAIVEFRLPARGRYMFHPHQREMSEHGAMGWFAAT